jgi:ketosteroid isomerase-like protein
MPLGVVSPPRRLWVIAWAVVTGLLLGAMGLGSLRVRHLIRRAQPLRSPDWLELAASVADEVGVSRQGYHLFRGDQSLAPMTWGWRRPSVLLPESCDQWSTEQRRQVLVHELAHIQRRDCLTQALANVACALYWFHPLVWLAARRMLVERERACDDQVLKSGAKASTYAGDLLEMARTVGADFRTAQISPAMARRSEIAGRLLAVLDPDRRRQAPSRAHVVLASAMAVLLALPLAALVAVQAELRTAFQRGDAAAIARLYTSDAEIIVGGATRVRGRRAIERFMAEAIGAGYTDVEVTSLELYPVGPMLCELDSYRGRHPVAALEIHNRFMTLWAREDGQWRLHRDIAVP